MFPFVCDGETGGTHIVLSGLDGVYYGIKVHDIEVDIAAKCFRYRLPDVHVDSLIFVRDHVFVWREIGIRDHLYGILLICGIVFLRDGCQTKE